MKINVNVSLRKLASSMSRFFCEAGTTAGEAAKYGEAYCPVAGISSVTILHRVCTLPPHLLHLFRASLPHASTGTPRPACSHSEYCSVEPSRLCECVSKKDALQLTDTDRRLCYNAEPWAGN